MKIDQYTRIMTAVRGQWILSVCGTAVTSHVKRGLQAGRSADRRTPRLNMKINLLPSGHCPCRVTLQEWLTCMLMHSVLSSLTKLTD